MTALALEFMLRPVRVVISAAAFVVVAAAAFAVFVIAVVADVTIIPILAAPVALLLLLALPYGGLDCFRREEAGKVDVGLIASTSAAAAAELAHSANYKRKVSAARIKQMGVGAFSLAWWWSDAEKIAVGWRVSHECKLKDGCQAWWSVRDPCIFLIQPHSKHCIL
jgi:uncharacterized protein YbdZ (MbtH family)